MHRIRLSLASLCLLLSACGGGGDSGADLALTKMHERMMVRLMENAVTMEHPLIVKTTTTLNVKILPASESYKGNASLSLTSSMMSDATNAKSPTADLTVTLIAKADIPPSAPVTAKAEQVSVYALMNARAVDRTLSVNFEKLDATAPAFLPTPFSLPEAITKNWYGKTFEELDVILKDLPREKGETSQPPIDEILTNAFRGIRMTPEHMEKLGENIHIWKGIRLLPGREEMGLVQVQVESDKRKIRDSVRALLTFMKEVSGPSFETQMRTNEDLQEMMESLTKNDAEFLRTMGSAKGILSADKTTFDFRGFDGDIFDEAGANTARVEIRHDANGDISVQIVELKTKETFHFSKTGADIRLTSATKTILMGTVTTEKVDFTVMDPKTGDSVMEATFTIDKLTKEDLQISRGVFVFPKKKLTVTVDSLKVNLSNSFKDFVMNFKASGKLDGKPLFTADFVGTRSEVAPFTVEKPQFLPFENLQQDFSSTFMAPMQTELE